MLFVRILAISGACLLAGCQASQQQEMTQAEALDAANAYVAREFPATNVVMSRPVLEDRNATWRVKYPPPEGYAGGGPTVEIDKRTHEVVNAFAEQ